MLGRECWNVGEKFSLPTSREALKDCLWFLLLVRKVSSKLHISQLDSSSVWTLVNYFFLERLSFDLILCKVVESFRMFCHIISRNIIAFDKIFTRFSSLLPTVLVRNGLKFPYSLVRLLSTSLCFSFASNRFSIRSFHLLDIFQWSFGCSYAEISSSFF